MTSTYLDVNLNINATLDLDFDGIRSFFREHRNDVYEVSLTSFMTRGLHR